MGVVVPATQSGLAAGRGPESVVHELALDVRAMGVLDESYKLLSSGQIGVGLDVLMGGLSELRSAADPEEWDSFCRSAVIDHPLGSIIWQDPFTAHSFKKPRGYPGDAQLLDYIYGKSPVPQGTSLLGDAIFQYNLTRQAPRSVRARAQILAGAIDETASQFAAPRILSVACGHLREAEQSKALQQGRIGQFIALDQDPQSLAEVERAYGHLGVQTACQSVRSILTEKTSFANIHLAYAAGLYDYLSDRAAARLTQLLFDMLAPGGRLLVANFAPCLADIGYIETYMAWRLLYREPEQMTALGHDIASAKWQSHRLFWDEHESIIFLEITKRSRISASISFGPGVKEAAVPGRKHMTIAPDAVSGPQRQRTRLAGSNGNGKAVGDNNGDGAAGRNGNPDK